jgi:hypothetical protein
MLLWLVAMDAALTTPVLGVTIARVHDIVTILILAMCEAVEVPLMRA